MPPRLVLPTTISGFLLLVLAGTLAVVVALRTADAERWVAHTIEVRQSLQQLFSGVQDLRIAQRGFESTKDPGYLDLYRRTLRELPVVERRLGELTADNPEQARALRQLGAQIEDFAAELDRLLETEGAATAHIALAPPSTAAGMLREIRGAVQAADRTEWSLYDQRRAAAARTRALLLVAMIATLLLTALLGVMVGLTIRHRMLDLQAANAALAAEAEARELAEAQLRQAQKMEALGRLVGGIAHDFNNMLTVVVGSLDMLGRKLQGADAQHLRLVQMAGEGAGRAALLTRRLLAFSRLQPLEPKPVDVNRCMGDLSEMLRRTLGENIALETVLAGGLWHALIDRPQLESAVLNVAINARDAMPSGGRLTIETANTYLDQVYAERHQEVQAGQYVLVAVTDTGTGMLPDVVARAFDPFFTTKPVGAGTGLGLSQVHGFIKQSGGHVKLYSEPGVGTTVKLYLPRHAGKLPMHSEPEAIVAAVGGSDLTVLVVEDEADVRAYTAEAVRELGYRVAVADSPEQALQMLQGPDPVDVLLTDIVMPGMTGRQLADAAAGLRPGLKVLYMTGYTRNAVVHNGALDVGTHLLNKPFTLAQLAKELQTVIAVAQPGGSPSTLAADAQAP